MSRYHHLYWAMLLQLTTEQGMKAGLEADQAAKLAHIESLDAAAAACEVV